MTPLSGRTSRARRDHQVEAAPTAARPEVLRVAQQLPGGTQIEVDLAGMPTDVVDAFSDRLEELSLGLVDVADGKARVALIGTLVLTPDPCGQFGCVATVTVQTSTTGLDDEALLTATATADISVEFLLDGRLVGSCQTSIAVPVNGEFSSACPASYAIPADGRYHPYNALWFTFVRVNAVVDAPAVAAQVVED